jgi:hypothetical protein
VITFDGTFCHENYHRCIDGLDYTTAQRTLPIDFFKNHFFGIDGSLAIMMNYDIDNAIRLYMHGTMNK